MLLHTRTEEEKNFCNICDKNFSSENSLKMHLKTHSKSDDEYKPHICDICFKAFPQKANLNVHKRDVHEYLKLRKHVCSICQKVFPTNTSLLRHMKVHLRREDREKFECSKCGIEFLTKYSFQKHIKANEKLINCKEIETKPPREPCLICEKEFNANYLAEHIKKKHT